MSKVYCQNCNYCRRGYQCQHAIDNVVGSLMKAGKKMKAGGWYDIPTKFDVCLFYKRKWWKFWVK